MTDVISAPGTVVVPGAGSLPGFARPPDVSPLARCARVDPATFAREHWNRSPLLSRATQLPGPFTDLLDAAAVDEMLAARGLRLPFFRLVRDGESLAGYTRTVTAGNRQINDMADPEKVRDLMADGATLVLQSLHRVWPPLVAFCRELAEELGHPTQCNGYVTPGSNSRGFAFHHDTHDVIVLQVDGRKHWQVYEPVIRLPLRSQPSSAYTAEQLVPPGSTALLDVELAAGDALYLPRGYVHAARTTDERSIHLTIGILATTWYDLLTDVVTLAANEADLREALPVPATTSVETLPTTLKRAAQWLAELPVERAAELLERRRDHAVPPEPLGVLAQAETARRLGPDTAVRPRRGLRPTVRRDGDQVVLTLPGKTVTMPGYVEGGLRTALAGPTTPAGVAGGELTVDDAVVLVRRLLREGALVVA